MRLGRRTLSSLEMGPVRPARVGSFLLSLLLLGLTSCGGSDGPGGTAPDTPRATTLSISQTSVTLSFLGATVTLNAAIHDQNSQPFSGTISWSTDNPAVVTVDAAGLLTAVKNGTATVSATSGSLSGTVAVTVQAQSTLELGMPISGIGAAKDAELLFAFELTEEDGSIEFALDGDPIQNADIYVQHGFPPQPPLGLDYVDEPSLGTCKGITPDSSESCLINAALPGTYHILIHAFTAFSGATLSVTTGLEVLAYSIELEFLTTPTNAQNEAFQAAATHWESIIPFDITDIPFENEPIDADACVPGQPAISDVVDDIRIYVDLDSIDGPGEVFGRASFCVFRVGTGLPVVGFMLFDTADLSQLEPTSQLTRVILHEMGHVLGIGTSWLLAELLRDPSTENPGADTHFAGPLAIAAFDAAGGTGYTGGEKVPVENDGVEGRADGHWRESVFRNELMTPTLSSGLEKLSAISIQSLADVGYRVDVSQADPYEIPGISAAYARRQGPVIDLGNDIWIGPMMGVDAQGRVIRR